jgi:competence protein ComEA
MSAHGPSRDDAQPWSRALGDTGSRRSAPGLLERGQGLVGRVRAYLGASAWSSLAGRALLFVLGLLVLAWIGRTATAAAPPAAAHREATADAGAGHSLSPASALPPPPPPPPTPVPTVASPAPPPATGGTTSHARATADDPVYVNHASAEELRRLPGVGPKRAEAIIALRQRMGRFQRVEDLLRVKGVGRTTLRKWRPLVRLDAPTRRDDNADGGTP